MGDGVSYKNNAPVLSNKREQNILTEGLSGDQGLPPIRTKVAIIKNNMKGDVGNVVTQDGMAGLRTNEQYNNGKQRKHGGRY